MARTNILLDDNLIKRAMQVSGAKTKREAVDRALREMVDCIIAQTCIAADVELLAQDHDFIAIARYTPLRLCAV